MNRIASRLYVNALVIALSLLLSAQSHADETTDPAVQKFFGELREARGVFERYIVTCTFTSSDFAEYPKGLKVTYQMSESDEHEIIVYDYSDCDDGRKQPTKWIGQSGNFYISGKTGAASVLAHLPKGRDPIGKTIPHFDVMGLGLGFFGELKFGTRFAKILDNYTKYPSLQVVDKDDIALLYSSNGRPRIVFDKKRGYWPIRSKLDHALWTIQLQQLEGIYVPMRLEFSELDNRMQPAGKLAVDFNWESINAPFKVGRDAAVALANQYGCEFVDDSLDR